MKRIFAVLFVFCPAATFGADGYILQSELLTKYNPGAKKTFTGYSYDTSGNRLDKRIYDGVDSSAALMSRVRYVYDASRRLSEEILIAPAGDTLSRVRYSYAAEGMTGIAILNEKGVLRFKDSLLYSNGRIAEERRYVGTATSPSYYHRYTYTGGLLSADSMYEAASGGGFAATQALLITRNTDSTVLREARWIVSGAQWYCSSTTKMLYSQKHLLSAAKYETDGAAGRLMDSLAYTYANGNRTREAHFDEERTLTYDIVYTWIKWPVTQIARQPGTLAPAARLTWYHDGGIRFGAPFTGTVAVYTAGGRKVCEERVTNGTCATLRLSSASGRYLAAINGTVRQSFTFTTHD